jgi:hypothetical protein
MQIREPADIADALGAGMASGGLLLDETQLGQKFFDLESGLAGEVLRKFTSYRVRLAIVLADPNSHGTRFGELVREHRAHDAVRFFDSAQRARQWLTYNPIVKC